MPALKKRFIVDTKQQSNKPAVYYYMAGAADALYAFMSATTQISATFAS